VGSELSDGLGRDLGTTWHEPRRLRDCTEMGKNNFGLAAMNACPSRNPKQNG